MLKKCFAAAVLMALLSLSAMAQDARTVVANASKAMGVDNLKSIQYTGTGWNAGVGQSFSPADDWPRIDITAYTRTIDYEARTSYEDLTRRQGDNPPRGGGGTPIVGDQRAISAVSGNYAWNVNGANVAPQPAAAELRQLDIWLSPHGVLKAAAQASDLRATPMTLEGRKFTIISFTLNNKYKVNSTPTIIVTGRKYGGLSLPQLRAVLDTIAPPPKS